MKGGYIKGLPFCLFFTKNAFMEIIKFNITRQDVDEYNSIYFNEHPHAKKPLIKAPQHPSINQYMIANNYSANKDKQNWKDFVVWCLAKTDLTNKQIEQCNIHYHTWFATNRRHDIDNISPKFILDGFVEAGLIVDDSMNNIRSLTISGGIDKINPRIEFVIEVIK